MTMCHQWEELLDWEPRETTTEEDPERVDADFGDERASVRGD